MVSCDEIAAGTRWLADLNGPDGSDEIYAPARWLTVYDGSGVADPAFAGPTYAQSPALKGADNRQFPGTYHNDLRLSPAIVAAYRAFLEQAEASATPPTEAEGNPPTLTSPSVAVPTPPASATGPAVPSPGAELPATGSADGLTLVAVLVGLALVVKQLAAPATPRRGGRARPT